MIRWKSWALSLVVLVVLIAAGACTNDSLDDGDSADVVLEIIQLEAQPVTAAAQQGSGTCSFSGGQCTVSADCPIAESCTGTTGCQLTAEEWSYTVANLPKNSVGITQPFNDVVMNSVEITYAWQIPGPPTGPATVGLGGVAIPVNGTGNIKFFPISSAALVAGGVEGNTADMTMVFQGRTVDGTGVTGVSLAQLNVESCP